jgi:hypothetical protein
MCHHRAKLTQAWVLNDTAEPLRVLYLHLTPTGVNENVLGASLRLKSKFAMSPRHDLTASEIHERLMGTQ